MAINANGTPVDTAGNVAVDFVWGNFPMQPNDIRVENGGSRLDYTLDSHNIIEDGWNGYPGYTPNTAGSQTSGVDYVTVPSVIGTVATSAATLLADLELVVTTAANATNSSKTVTAASRTSGSHLLSLTASTHGFSAGQLVIISSVDAAANGTWIVDGSTSANTLVVGTTPTTALSLTGLSGAAIAVSGSVKAQSVAATTKVAAGSAITITPWA